MKLPDNINLGLSYLISLLFILILFSKFIDGPMMGLYMSSDSLYLDSIFRDIFLDGTGFQGWHLNGQPNFFPDMPLYFLIMAIFRNTLITSFLFSVLQYFALVFLFNNILKIQNIKFSTTFSILSNYILLIFILSPLFGEDFLLPSQLLMINYHTSMVIMALLCLNLSFRYLQNHKGSTLILLGVMTLFGSLSDRLFLMAFSLPILVIVTAKIIKSSRSRFPLYLGITTLGSAVIGQVIFKAIRFSGFFFVANDSWKMYQFHNIGTSFINLMNHMGGIIKNMPIQRWIIIFSAIFILFSIIYLFINLKKYFRDQLDGEKEKHYTFLLIFTVICLVAFFTPVINGSYIGIALIRYNFHALVLGSVGFAYLLLLLAESLNIKEKIISYTGYLMTFGMVILLGVTWVKSDVKSGLKDYFEYYPERSMILDQLKDEHDLTFGIADYWKAKFSTTFSKNGVRLYAANDENFRPFYHVTNENWFHDGGKGVHKNPVFNYVLTDGYKKTDKLIEIFGSDMDTIYNQNNIMVVKVPEFKFDRKTKEIYLIE